MTSKRWATYTGGGTAFHAGIPARDLTEEDRDALSADDRAVVESSPIYKVAAADKKAEKGGDA